MESDRGTVDGEALVDSKGAFKTEFVNAIKTEPIDTTKTEPVDAWTCTYDPSDMGEVKTEYLVEIKKELTIEPTVLQQHIPPGTDLDGMTQVRADGLRLVKQECKSDEEGELTSCASSSPLTTYSVLAESEKTDKHPYNSCTNVETEFPDTNGFLLDKNLSTLKKKDDEKLYKYDHCLYQASHIPRPHICNKPYKCDLCQYLTCSLTAWKRHIITHNGEKPFKCHLCQYQVNTVRSLKHHYFSHSGEKPYKCNHCPYQATRAVSLRNHMRTHTGEKPFKCDHCSYQASQLYGLKLHMRTHTGEKPYHCEHCQYQTTHSTSLKNHMRIHTGEKPFKCEHCSYQASRYVNLMVHIRRHTGEKPYKCDYCQYRSTNSTNLKKHVLLHTSEKSYKRTRKSRIKVVTVNTRHPV